jgi:kynurenine formamidase
MADLAEFAAQLLAGEIEVVDLTSPLHASTPILQLPPQWGQTQPFQLEEISRYDERGPAWYWNNIRTGEHTGTHLDAPNHWLTGKGKEDVSGSGSPARVLALAAR